MEFAYQNQSILDWRVGENRAIVTSDSVETYLVEEGEKRNGSIWENKVSLDQDEKVGPGAAKLRISAHTVSFYIFQKHLFFGVVLLCSTPRVKQKMFWNWYRRRQSHRAPKQSQVLTATTSQTSPTISVSKDRPYPDTQTENL